MKKKKDWLHIFLFTFFDVATRKYRIKYAAFFVVLLDSMDLNTGMNVTQQADGVLTTQVTSEHWSL